MIEFAVIQRFGEAEIEVRTYLGFTVGGARKKNCVLRRMMYQNVVPNVPKTKNRNSAHISVEIFILSSYCGNSTINFEFKFEL